MKKTLPFHHFNFVRWAFILFAGFVITQPVFGQQSSRSLIPKGTNGTPFGFFEYLPNGYSPTSSKKPLILYLHGAGELGNGTSDLSKMRQRALPKLLQNGKEIDFVVIAPQAPSWWHYHDLMPMLNWIKENYNIDPERIYLTGISMGGTKVWDFAGDHPDQITAVSPLGADARNQNVCRLSSVPVWAFHGKNDNVYPASAMTAAINTLNKNCNPVANPAAKGTVYSNRGHDDLWDYVYNGTYGDDIYQWMLQHRKSGTSPPPANQAPIAHAGLDINIKLPTNSVTIKGSGSDADGSISAYRWSKISGPAAKLSQTSSASLYASELVAGTYEFELMVTDNAGATAKDRMKVNVAAADDDSPVSAAGLNYKYYEGSWSVLPNFSSLTPKKTGTVSNFSLSPKSRNNQFAFLYEGYIKITTAGTYTFYTASDDGSKLYINGKQVVNNDGLHALQEKSGSVYLTAGSHPIRVTYFERYGSSESLSVSYKGPGISKKKIPNEVLSTGGSSSTLPPPPSSSTAGLSYKYYEGSWSMLPNFSTLQPKRTGSVSNFSLAPRKSNNLFGFVFEGYIKISTAGTYTFYTASDDGSKLYINGQQIVNNDGMHGLQERSGSVQLTAGLHPIKVTYFEKYSGEQLSVSYSGPGISKRKIPDGVLSNDGNSSSTAGTTALLSNADEEPEAITENTNHPSESLHLLNNPVSDGWLRIATQEANVLQEGEVFIYDTAGRRYQSLLVQGSSINTWEVSTQQLHRGIYVLLIKQANGQEQRLRFILR
jgi:predicted esterase